MAGAVYHRYRITIELTADPRDGLGDARDLGSLLAVLNAAADDEIASVESAKVADLGEVEED
jgi:hypothetical protein